MRHLGIDYGAKRVGIALSDEAGAFAFPETVLANDGDLLSRIGDLVQRNGVERIVLGASYDFKGKENPIMKDILRFKKKLEDELHVDVRMHSETMTSAEARRPPEEGGGPRSRKPRLRKKVDASAAAIILQSFLDSHVSDT